MAEHVASLSGRPSGHRNCFRTSGTTPTGYTPLQRRSPCTAERDELLRVLLRRVSRTGEIRGDPSADDAGNKVRQVLALVAAESREGDWSTEAATVIGQARVELARSGALPGLGESAGWPSSNSQIRQIAITRLAGDVDSQETVLWVRGLAEFDLVPGDKDLASEAVLRQLRTETHGWSVRYLADALARLGPAPQTSAGPAICCSPGLATAPAPRT